VLATSVLPVSAVTGEGLDELWTLIERTLTPRRAPLHPEPRRGTNNSQPRPKPPPRP
jgi:putative protein kinase ArgK-like GTPase of G3E family